ncbi:MAG: CoA transferase, partial [Dehalococcoidia bacterium]
MAPPDAGGVGLPLEGVRVVEIADHRGEFCGRLLANMGADLVKVEPPEGSTGRRIGPFYEDQPGPERSLYWWHYNAAKRGVTLDIKRRDGARVLERLLDGADVLIETLGPGGLEAIGLAWDGLHRRCPALVVLSLSDFGLDGPWSRYHGGDLVFLALGGQMMISGYPPDPDGAWDTPPIAPQMHQSFHIAGCLGAMDVLAALAARDNTGRGQRIDLSIHAAANNCTENNLSWYMIGGIVKARAPQFPEMFTGDGKYMSVMLGLFPGEWERVVELLDEFEMAA